MVRTEVARVVGEHLANAKVTFATRKRPTPRPRVMPCGVPQSEQIQTALGKLPPGKGATVAEICEAIGATKRPTIATAAHRLVRRVREGEVEQGIGRQHEAEAREHGHRGREPCVA